MKARIDMFALAPKAMTSYLSLTEMVEKGPIEKSILELVKIRAAQINGCANCLNMHTSDASKAGETQQRLHLIAAWRDAPVFSERERAALAWTEAMTRLADHDNHDAALASLTEQFDAQEQVALTLGIVVTNGWNRLAIGCGMFDEGLGW